MATVQETRSSIVEALQQAGIEPNEARREADLIVEHATGLNTAGQIVHAHEQLETGAEGTISEILERRRQRVPLQYCLGHAWFMGLEFEVEPGVFIPRSDTEIIVTTALELMERGKQESWRLAEIGIGSGAISVALLKNAGSVEIAACDMSRQAVELSLRNAARHAVSDRLSVKEGDWKQLLPHGLDGIISNPPYIPIAERRTLAPEVADHEPALALFGKDEDGLRFYREFASRAKDHFAERGGFALVEVGDRQADNVVDIFQTAGWSDVTVHLDMNGLPRAVSGFC